MLLECGRVNPELSDTLRGRTPIPWAAGNGHEGIVKMLLGQEGINPDQVDTDCGQTPISWAASHGHEGVVKMLLEREGVNPDQADTQYGPTPLMWAAWHEVVWVVKFCQGGCGPVVAGATEDAGWRRAVLLCARKLIVVPFFPFFFFPFSSFLTHSSC